MLVLCLAVCSEQFETGAINLLASVANLLAKVPLRIINVSPSKEFVSDSKHFAMNDNKGTSKVKNIIEVHESPSKGPRNCVNNKKTGSLFTPGLILFHGKNLLFYGAVH